MHTDIMIYSCEIGEVTKVRTFADEHRTCRTKGKKEMEKKKSDDCSNAAVLPTLHQAARAAGEGRGGVRYWYY